jgi:hypothetical protein
MKTYWVKFEGFPSMSVEAADEAEAKRTADDMIGKKVVKVDSLPYPARPRLTRHQDPKYGICPAFCFKPEECKGNTACPQSYSCTE